MAPRQSWVGQIATLLVHFDPQRTIDPFGDRLVCVFEVVVVQVDAAVHRVPPEGRGLALHGDELVHLRVPPGDLHLGDALVVIVACKFKVSFVEKR